MRLYAVSKKALIAVLRWLLFFVAAYLVASGGKHSPALFLPLLGLFAASNIALGLVSAERFRRWRLNYAVVVFDVLFISAMIYLTGDLDLYIFYFFTILMASYGRNIQGSLLVAVLASGFYVWMAVRTGSVATLLSPTLLIRIPFFYLVALISSFMAEESITEEERLTWTRIILGMTQELAARAQPRRGSRPAAADAAAPARGRRRPRLLRRRRPASAAPATLRAGAQETWPAAEFGLGPRRRSRGAAPFPSHGFPAPAATAGPTPRRPCRSPPSPSRRTPASAACSRSTRPAPRSSASGCARSSASPH